MYILTFWLIAIYSVCRKSLIKLNINIRFRTLLLRALEVGRCSLRSKSDFTFRASSVRCKYLRKYMISWKMISSKTQKSFLLRCYLIKLLLLLRVRNYLRNYLRFHLNTRTDDMLIGVYMYVKRQLIISSSDIISRNSARYCRNYDN